MTFKSVDCQVGTHADCDGLVHWAPVRRDGLWMGNVAEADRPRDLRPHICPCGCHSPSEGAPHPLVMGVSGEGDT